LRSTGLTAFKDDFIFISLWYCLSLREVFHNLKMVDL
jgi:hypothetical protein